MPLITPSRVARDEQIVAVLLAGIPQLAAIYRYGSAGGPYETAASDIDLVVLADMPLDHALLSRLAIDLWQRLGKEIDLNDMRRLPVTLRVQIVTHGTRLFARQPAVAEEYDSRVLSDYARLNESRRAILANVRERGNIHG